MCCQWRLRSDPVHMLSKNFLATHQVDIDLWTEFLYVACRANCPSHLVCKKRADTVGELRTAETCVSYMPSLKAKKLEKLTQEKAVLER
jgi:hypothetical protein